VLLHRTLILEESCGLWDRATLVVEVAWDPLRRDAFCITSDSAASRATREGFVTLRGRTSGSCEGMTGGSGDSS
jgi:hypothetical protein